MAYCRWSSMNWQCDVYTYEDVGGGWTTHVAARRRAIPTPPLWMPPSHWITGAGAGRLAAWRWRAACRVSFWTYRLQMITLDLIPLRPIGLPFDGESFNDPTAGDCAERLVWLRGLGYIVPQDAIDALREEAADADQA